MKTTRTIPPMIHSKAEITTDLTHRYSLQRTWDESLPAVMFIGLNPSRADHSFNDPTITRCINFAYDWGYGTLYFANLYSFRTPYVTQKQADVEKKRLSNLLQMIPEQHFEALIPNLDKAVGPDCDKHLLEMMDKAKLIIVAWGSWKFIGNRSRDVLHMIKNLNKVSWCLGENRDGHPKHPLYLHALTKPNIYGGIVPAVGAIPFGSIKRYGRSN